MAGVKNAYTKATVYSGPDSWGRYGFSLEWMDGERRRGQHFHARPDHYLDGAGVLRRAIEQYESEKGGEHGER